MDLHFPSCYDPSKDLTDYKNNMAFPTVDVATGKQNCPTGWTHVPHLFYEMYWNTPLFVDRWTPNQDYQPFVLSNGDLSGCSTHGDFLAGWDTTTLQHIIDTCDAGDIGMDTCAGVTVRDKSTTCNVASPIDETITGNLTALPGNNPLTGWGTSYGPSGTATSSAAASSSSSVVASVSVSADVDVAATSSTSTLTTSTTTASAVSTTSVTTLPNGHVVTTTIVDWVTVTTVVYERDVKTDSVNKRSPRWR